MTRVFIADERALLRDGLRRILADAGDMTHAGEAATGAEALRRAGGEAWDVLLLGLPIPGVGDFDALKKLLLLQPTLRILVLSTQAEDAHALRILEAGASGFLSKDRPATMLLDAIRTVHAGRRYVTAELAELMLDRPRGLRAEEPHASLSRRELEILVQIGRGKGTSEIAGMLDLSASTVSTHLGHIKAKLGRGSIAELAQYALTAGLLGR